MGGSSKRLSPAAGRIRKCVGCGGEKPKTEMIRVVRAPDGTVSLNAAGKAPGRGAYICADAACVRTAAKKNALARALKCQVDRTLYASLEELCLERNTGGG